MFNNLLKEGDLKIAIILPLLFMILVLISPIKENSVRIILSLPFMLFLPGYSLVGVLFPRKNDLTIIERTAFSFIFSIAIVPLLGLILNFTPFGIRLVPILIIISTFTISLSIVTWIRRLKFPVEERFRLPFEKILKVNLGQSILDKGFSIVLIASIIGSSATLVYVAMTPKPNERFTEFSLLGSKGMASDYPVELIVGEDGKVIISIENHEYENIIYRLEINFNDSLIHKENIFLIENGKWESPLTFKTTKKGENQKLEFLLYIDQQQEVYRTLHLWINVK